MLGSDVADPEKLREIVERARRVRKPLPRWLWIAAVAVGAACIGAFLWLYLQEPGTPPTTPAHREVAGPGFASGVAIGVLAGFLVGWAIARQRAGHSSRNNP